MLNNVELLEFIEECDKYGINENTAIDLAETFRQEFGHYPGNCIESLLVIE